jgi:hypothetical protein
MRARGVVATLQSAAMYGRGRAVTNGVVRAVAAAGGLVTGTFNYPRPAARREEEEEGRIKAEL